MESIKVKDNYIYEDGVEIKVRIEGMKCKNHYFNRITLEEVKYLTKVMKDEELVRLLDKLKETASGSTYRKVLNEMAKKIKEIAMDDKYREEFKERVKKTINRSKSRQKVFREYDLKAYELRDKRELWDFVERKGIEGLYLKELKTEDNRYLFIIEELALQYNLDLIDQDLKVWVKSVKVGLGEVMVLGKIKDLLESKKYEELIGYLKKTLHFIDTKNKQNQDRYITTLKLLYNKIKEISKFKWFKNKIAMKLF